MKTKVYLRISLGYIFGTFHSRIISISLKRLILLGRGVYTPEDERSFLPVPADPNWKGSRHYDTGTLDPVFEVGVI